MGNFSYPTAVWVTSLEFRSHVWCEMEGFMRLRKRLVIHLAVLAWCISVTNGQTDVLTDGIAVRFTTLARGSSRSETIRYQSIHMKVKVFLININLRHTVC